MSVGLDAVAGGRGQAAGLWWAWVVTDMDHLLLLGLSDLSWPVITVPSAVSCRYDPYPRQLTRERYDHEGMQVRMQALCCHAVPPCHAARALASLWAGGEPCTGFAHAPAPQCVGSVRDVPALAVF